MSNHDDAVRLDGITAPLSVPCAVCGCERPYLLAAEGPPPLPPRWQGLLRPRRAQRVRESRCEWCGAL
jgi:hypothetical protein